MKNVSLVISVISLIAAITFGVLFLTKDTKKADAPAEGEATEVVASKGDIVYIDLDRILMEYDMANDLRAVVETKAQNIQAEIALLLQTQKCGTQSQADQKTGQIFHAEPQISQLHRQQRYHHASTQFPMPCAVQRKDRPKNQQKQAQDRKSVV